MNLKKMKANQKYILQITKAYPEYNMPSAMASFAKIQIANLVQSPSGNATLSSASFKAATKKCVTSIAEKYLKPIQLAGLVKTLVN